MTTDKRIRVRDGIRFSTPNYYQESLIAKSETNDCVVRAFAAAFDVEYDAAHAWCKSKFLRKNRQGTYATQYRLMGVGQKWNKQVKVIGEKLNQYSSMIVPLNSHMVKGVRKTYAMTVGSFAKKYKEGSFIVLIDRHALAVVEGVIFGNYEDAVRLKARVRGAFEVIGDSRLGAYCNNQKEGEPKVAKIDLKEQLVAKKCCDCGEVKSKESFHKDGQAKDGLLRRCKKCYTIWNSPEERAKRKALRNK